MVNNKIMRTLNGFISEHLECPKLSISEHLECPKLSISERLKLNKDTKLQKNDYVDLGLPSGTLWAPSNIGATCESTPESWYGDYFMWGDTTPATNKICNWENYKYSNGEYNYLTKYCYDSYYWNGQGDPDYKLKLDLNDDIVNKKLGGKYHIPSKELLEELINNTTSKWVTNYQKISNLNGRLFTSKKNDNTLFFPASGYRSDNYFKLVGSYFYICSSNLDSDFPHYAIGMYAYHNNAGVEYYSRYFGVCVRGVLDRT